MALRGEEHHRSTALAERDESACAGERCADLGVRIAEPRDHALERSRGARSMSKEPLVVFARDIELTGRGEDARSVLRGHRRIAEGEDERATVGPDQLDVFLVLLEEAARDRVDDRLLYRFAARNAGADIVQHHAVSGESAIAVRGVCARAFAAVTVHLLRVIEPAKADDRLTERRATRGDLSLGRAEERGAIRPDGAARGGGVVLGALERVRRTERGHDHPVNEQGDEGAAEDT